MPTPKAFLNAKCGNAAAARKALTEVGFDLEEVDPTELESRLKKAIDDGAKRILVAGGDGTIATAASLVAKTGVELAILPGGTLNHFAKDHNIPTDLGKAALAAAGAGIVTSADIGYVNDCVFLNTSSIGAYVTFVRDRERFEKHVGYSLASIGAFFKTMSDLRSFSVTLEVEGTRKTYRSSLVFIGVGERELKLPILGNRVENGRRGLHVMIVRGRKRARLFTIALAAIAKGTREASRLPEFEDFVVDSCRIDLFRPTTTIGLDGELKRLATPLDYRIERDALRLVVAPPDGAE
ncbi:MAG TPA: diacylglycerol kinase family protein [Gemmatimonadaceae bacterium]|jgi:diacylglycerol kinase family enzyme|nr:diacylglycerol kinase family protein [Gemmatimonadaceae bacterium]